MAASSSRSDPFQIYQVNPEPCFRLDVKVVCGRNITYGWRDYFDTPDPYVRLFVKNAPEGRKRTTVKNGDVAPVWNESFTFLLQDRTGGIMDIYLMESNWGPDGTAGQVRFNLDDLTIDKLEKKTFTFDQVAEIDMEVKLSVDKNPAIRFSSSLCDQEKEYLEKRKHKTLKGLQQLLGERGPQSLEEAPTIAVIGSGGGFRAMVGLNGVFNALQESGLLECATYVSGLSGSSWYISTLYSNEAWPSKISTELENELKKSIDDSLIWQFVPSAVTKYIYQVLEKRRRGQPVSFTDIYGRMVGDILINNRIETKLSDQRTKLIDGDVPLPLLTAVLAKKNRSAQSFHEWIEFSPYEVGMAKYGIYIPTDLFGSKFYLGRLCRKHLELPLHFLQGVWGSAYSLTLNRLKEIANSERPIAEDAIRHVVAKEMEESTQDDSSDSSEDEGEIEDDTTNAHECKRSKMRTKKSSFWKDFITKTLLGEKIMNSRGNRPGVTHNCLRGLSLSQLAEPANNTICPCETDVFDGMFEKNETSRKHQYMIDAGLTFNSPYPIVMRSQREVDIILSFDFTGRVQDDSPPFGELILAAKWAMKRGVPFPPIDITDTEKGPLKELYVFKHPTDPHCPVVLHFPLVNNEFRKFVKPGVERTTDEERDFGDFSIFDDCDTPYTTYNFTYSRRVFDRLSKLTEFNTLVNLETIKDAIADVIQEKQKMNIDANSTII